MKQCLSDTERYLYWQDCQKEIWEAKCLRCGACCGAAENDPCEHLVASADGTYACRIYAERFGLRTSVSGRKFHCVPIRTILHKSWRGDWKCAYKKL